ncbi:MAG: LEVG family PEP-CTERM protein [Rivularia sp. T60_A2020_040]|nr:LEVG family PEP-CTERM protein [Rivularia sp. T60_A2020_040]
MGKFNIIAAIFGLGLGLAAAPAAHAVSLIPTQEGEIILKNQGLFNDDSEYKCIAGENCIDTSKKGFSVTSLQYDFDDKSPIYGLSRLFVDKKGTANDYGFGIKFSAKDLGTNEGEGEYWLRGVAYEQGKDGKFNPAEKGELEVGRFLFEFGREFDQIVLDLFDVEASGFSGVLEVNGQKIEDMLLAAGPDGNTQTLMLNNVSSFVLQLGQPRTEGFSKTGDGVSLSAVRSVPEPTTTFSLGALAVAGMFGVKKRQKLKK